MRKWFYIWLWKKLYLRAEELGQQYAKQGNVDKMRYCIKLQNYMNYIREELITGKAKGSES